jgi:hypothetical protein
MKIGQRGTFEETHTLEKLPKEVIQKQQQMRIQHLEKEIPTFRDNIEKIRRGGP